MSIVRSSPAVSASIVPCATTRPLSTIAARSQVFSTSSSRCEESRTVRPSSTSERTSPRNSRMPAGVEAPVARLVEDQQLGVAQQAAGDAEPLAHAQRVGPDLVVGARGRARRGPARPALARGRRGRGRRRARAGSRARSGADGSAAPRRSRRPAPARRRARPGRSWPSSRIVPEVGCARPSSRRTSVVLPAPLRPRKPNAQPRGTSRSIDSRAARAPKRLPSPWVSMASEFMPTMLGATAAARHRPRGPSAPRVYTLRITRT